MQRLEVSGAVRSLYGSLDVKGLNKRLREPHGLMFNTTIYFHSGNKTFILYLFICLLHRRNSILVKDDRIFVYVFPYL